MRKQIRFLLLMMFALIAMLSLTSCDAAIENAVLQWLFDPNYYAYEDTMKKALDEENPAICWELRDEDETSSCYRKVAAKLHDPDACGRDPDEQELCYLAVAEAMDDPSICMRISERDEGGRAFCLRTMASKQNDANVCILAVGWVRKSCWHDLAANQARQGHSATAICDIFESDQQLQAECVTAATGR